MKKIPLIFALILIFSNVSFAQWVNVLTCDDVSSIAINGNNIYVGSYYSGVYLSTDNGSSWSAVNSGLANIYVNALTISGINIFAKDRYLFRIKQN